MAGDQLRGRSYPQSHEKMALEDSHTFGLHRPNSPLPGEFDFDPIGCCLDAQDAWKHFGGLSLSQAYSLFLNNPLYYQEDFMFMGGNAFHYYFPVVDRYLRNVTGDDDWDDCEAAILGSGVVAQLESKDILLTQSFFEEIGALARFVRTNLNRYSPLPQEQQRIDKEWANVEEKLSSHQNKE